MKQITLALIAGLVGLTAGTAMADEPATMRVFQRAESLARRAAYHLDSARTESDLRKARCHDGVLSETNAVIRQLRLRFARMNATSDATQRAHHEAVFGVLDRRLDEIEASLRTCNGEHFSATPNGTQVIVIISPDVPRDDPTRLREPRRFAPVPR